jgi:murein DD-endopeptidase MepM/ murein hydrolase activator NlpD
LATPFLVLAACLGGTTNPATGAADGCPGVAYPDWRSSPYVLPYPVGLSYGIDLSNCSDSFHGEGEPDQFAIDFAMPIGTVITASRDGTVVGVEESGVDLAFPNNLVVVDHGDGTFGQYMHLTENGALVAIGDRVTRGDTLGLSGATGSAGYPHLHFVVTSDDWAWPYASVPVTFNNTTENPRSLQSGATYTALSY